jgi:hypothetical protein
MQPERASAWVPASVIAAVVAIVTALASHFLLEAGLRSSMPSLRDGTRTGTAAVGQAVAAQFGRALELGIPLDRLPGIEAYLQEISASSPQVEGLALLDASGNRIAATGEDVEGAAFPIAAGGAQATLIVAAESPLIDRAIERVRIALAMASLLAGIVAGGIVASFITFHRDPLQRRFADDMRHVAAGDFTLSAPVETRGPLSDATRTLVRGIEKVKAARRNLVEAVATIRAIDFDGSLGRRVDAILQPVEGRYVFADEADDQEASAAARGGGVAWRLVLFLALYAAAFPYVANFAIDRESEVVAIAWAPILPLLAELAAAIVGALAGGMRFARGGASLGLGCLVLGISLAATYWCRTYELFVVLRALAGFSAGLVAAGFLIHRRLGVQPRDLAVLLIFAALLAAPLLAGLYAEAIGRRSGFLVLGIAVLVATPFVALGAGWAIRRPAFAAGSANRGDFMVALAVLPASAAILATIPAAIGVNDYLAGTGAVATIAVAALLAPRVSPLVYGFAFLAAAAIAAYPSSQPLLSLFASCIFLGFAAGGVLTSSIAEANRPWTAMGIGAGLGLVLSGATAQFGIPFAVVVASAAVILIASALLGQRPAIAEPA